MALTGPLLTADECRAIADLYDDAERFRSTIDMARHRFGRGEYRYFAYPLPDAVGDAARRVLAPPAADRPRLGRPARRAGPMAGRLRGLARRVPRRRATAPDAVAPALRTGRLERPAPRPLRGAGVPAAGRHRPRRARYRLHRRRARGRRATTAGAVPGHDDHDPAGPRPRADDAGSPDPHGTRLAARPMRHGVSTVRSGRRHTLGLVFHDAA